MDELYEHGRGVFVGIFTEADVVAGKDNIATSNMKEKTGLCFTNSRQTKKGLMIWVCNAEDFRI